MRGHPLFSNDFKSVQISKNNASRGVSMQQYHLGFSKCWNFKIF